MHKLLRPSAAIVLALGWFTATQATAGSLGVDPDLPQVDFRSTDFAAADQQHSYTITVDGIEMTISAFSIDADGNKTASSLWWDDIDGLGVRGDEDDEVDPNEQLLIEFGEAIGISHIFLSDLFMDEEWNGLLYDETADISLNGGTATTVSARDIQGNTGNAANGEGVYLIDPPMLVSSLAFSVGGGAIGRQNFAVLGFVDPVVGQIPVPAPLLLFAGGLLMLAGIRRRGSA